MMVIYSGVIYTIPIPKVDVNEILKKVVKIVSEELDVGVYVHIYNSHEIEKTELGILEGDYYLKISTDDFNDEWKEDELKAVGIKIKEVTGTKVGMEVCRPCAEVDLSMERPRTISVENKKGGVLSQEEIDRLIAGLPLEEDEV